MNRGYRDELRASTKISSEPFSPAIGPLKNKQQIVKALEKAAGEELAEKAKKEAVEAAKKEKIKD